MLGTRLLIPSLSLPESAHLDRVSGGTPRDGEKRSSPEQVQETRVPSLGREDPLEKEMAVHSNILAWKISWTEEPGGLQRVAKSQTRVSQAHT